MIDKLTIAAGDVPKMASFYEALLGVALRPVAAWGAELRVGAYRGVELMLCPKDLAGISARENTIQVRFVVDDVDAAVAAALAVGGLPLGDPQDIDGLRLAALRDPDGNSVELVSRPAAER